ncbi:MAG: hypothetical protein JSU73_13050 [candidate division WOR-3 bacterium]|nr:MAG: hypothetical protein JSU73_13050 [candidate division WOR-3 bacterium]
MKGTKDCLHLRRGNEMKRLALNTRGSMRRNNSVGVAWEFIEALLETEELC